MKIVSLEKKVDIGLLERRFKDHYAQISTNQLLRIKNSIKDVARSTWGEVPYEINALCETIPNAPQGIEDLNFLFGYKGEDEKEVEGIFKTHKGLQEYAKKYPEQWEKVKRLLSTMRAKSRHAAAVVITNRPVNEFIPTMEIGGVRATQYTMKSCESSGAIKMDFLTLNTLNDIKLALKLIQKRFDFWTRADQYIDGKRVPAFRVLPHQGKLYHIWDLPEDQKVFNSIAEGDTETVFQVGTSSAKKWLKEFNYCKTDKEDAKLIDSIPAIAVFTALDRPGPLDAFIEKDGMERNMLQEYASRLRGEEPWDPIEFLDDQLKLTRGVITFQEQLQSIYQQLTDCTGVEADQFRDKIGKKKMAEVLKAYPNFMEKVTPKFGEEVAQRLWDQIYTFGQYGFCIDGSQKIMTDKGFLEMEEVVRSKEDIKLATYSDGGIDFQIPADKWSSGEKEVFEVELEDGTVIRGTKDHQFLYNGDWVRLEELINIGEMEVLDERSNIL